MTAVSRRDVGNALAARALGITPATLGYYGKIGQLLPGAADTTPLDPPKKSTTDLRVVPYFIVYPGAGTDGPDRALCGGSDATTITVAITAAAGDVEDLLALIDRLDARYLDWSPTLAGWFPGPLRRSPGYEAPVLPDPAFTPPRFYTRLQYQLTI